MFKIIIIAALLTLSFASLDGIDGVYRLKSLHQNGKEVKVGRRTPFSAIVKPNEESYDISFKVVNTMFGTLSKDSKFSFFSTTLISVYGKAAKVEKLVLKLLQNDPMVEYNEENSTLTLTGSGIKLELVKGKSNSIGIWPPVQPEDPNIFPPNTFATPKPLVPSQPTEYPEILLPTIPEIDPVQPDDPNVYPPNTFYTPSYEIPNIWQPRN